MGHRTDRNKDLMMTLISRAGEERFLELEATHRNNKDDIINEGIRQSRRRQQKKELYLKSKGEKDVQN